MQTNVTLEEAMQRASNGLRRKMEHSAELLRKAERLALAYDPEDGYFLAFSGGKDSQALYHMAELAGVRFRGHMNLTSVDPPEVIRFVKREYPEVLLTKPRDSIFNIAVQRQILPTMRVRWCCAEFKETAGAGKVTLIGIRHQESSRRAKRNEVEISSRKFSGTLDGLDEYRQNQREKRMKRKSQKQGVNITNATDEQTVGCIHWTEHDVWEFLNDVVRVPHCELYDQGWHRIDCINCPMASAKQKARENERWPHVKRGWIKAIMRIRAGGATPTRRTSGEPTAQSGQCGGAETARLPRVTSGGTSQPRCSHPAESEECYYGTDNPQHFITRLQMQHFPVLPPRTTADEHRPVGGFSGGSSPDGLTEEQEREIAENIYDWWISGKGYKQWYAEKFLQTKLDFE